MFILRQFGQKVKFFGRELDRLSVECDDTGVQFDGEAFETEQVFGLFFSAAAKDCIDSGHKFFGAERFGDIVIGAQMKA